VVESLYQDVLEKDPETKRLEDIIQLLKDSKQDSLGAFGYYDGKNSSYYTSATSYADRIGDPALKKKVKDMIAASMTDYLVTKARHVATLENIDGKTKTIEDLHLALKIIKTLPAIRKYQIDDLPSIMPIEHYLQQQNEAIKLADLMIKR
jgi:hypothetical protein